MAVPFGALCIILDAVHDIKGRCDYRILSIESLA